MAEMPKAELNMHSPVNTETSNAPANKRISEGMCQPIYNPLCVLHGYSTCII